MNMGKRPSQREIARLAGVAVSTVSRTLTHSPGISDEVRERVSRIAKDLGYPVEKLNGVVEPQRQDAVDAMVPLSLFSSDSSGFYHGILKGISEELKVRGAELKLLFLQDSERPEELVAAHCAQRPLQSLLLIALDDPQVLAAVVNAGNAAVIVNGQDPDMRLSGIMPANFAGAGLAVRHLLGLGHRRIAVCTSRNRSALIDRYNGFRRAIRQGGGEYDSSLFVELPSLDPEMAFQRMQARLASGPRDFTAVVCGNDMVAAGVLRALSDAGISVPDDCSVVGFDDIAAADFSRPRLTTIHVDAEAVGRSSVRQLLLLKSESGTDPATPIDIHIGCRLIVRDSTAFVAAR